ncbi:MAG: DUF4956 domain-containing protein [Lachnospiraceae bacterium]|nr:DUF4956 domain-containing protein [Lachnospiraceae bacterium]
MKTELLNYLVNNAGALSVEKIALNFITVVILSFCIYVSYKFSYNKLAYSARFNASLVLLAIITTLIMSCIGNNVALSLGMVGALSIVRFRTAVKDARDTAYIFWAIAIGICCGVSDYEIAVVGTAFIFVVILIFGNVQDNARYLLVIRSDRKSAKDIREVVEKYYNKGAIFRTDNSNLEQDEIIYLVSSKVKKKAEKKNGSLNEKLYEIEGVIDVKLISQNNEMNA